MSNHELLEMASLDALGLLDADERDAFERAFRAASPALQANIRREQLRLSRMEDMLPAVDAPLGLKARVLSAVREAIDTMSMGSLKLAGDADDAIAPALSRSRGVHRLWRTAAISALAASMVLGFFSLNFLYAKNEMTDTVAASAMSESMTKTFGNRFDQSFFSAHARMFTFDAGPDHSATAAKATILADTDTRRAQLYCRDMPRSDTDLEIVVTDRDGKQTVVASFRPAAVGVTVVTIENFNPQAVVSVALRRVGQTDAMLLARAA